MQVLADILLRQARQGREGLRRLGDTAILRMAQSFWRDKIGSALIEGAVLMPVLFAVVGGVFEFSWIFYKQKQIEAGVRDAARYLSRVPAPPATSPCAATDPGGTQYTTYAQNIAVYGSTSTSGFNPRVNGWGPGDVTITCPTFDNSALTYTGGATLYRILVTTSYAEPSLGFFGLLGLSAPNISASHQERYIGPG